MELDERDLQILDVLREYGRLPNLKISEITEIPITTVHNKVKRLENEGIILQYSARLHLEKVGYGSAAYILISLDNNKLRELNETHESLTEKIASKFPLVSNVSAVAGRFDVVLRIRAKSNTDMNKIADQIRSIEGVLKTETLISLHDVTRNKLISEFSRKWKKQHKGQVGDTTGVTN